MTVFLHKILYTWAFLLVGFASANANKPRFTQNLGQWNSNVLFRTELNAGAFFVDKQGFSVLMLEDGYFDKLHSWIGGRDTLNSAKQSFLKMEFTGAQMSHEAILGNTVGAPLNYFKGNDPKKWAKNVMAHKSVIIPQIYSGIDIEYTSTDTKLKYNLLVAPNADPSKIKLRISGHSEITLRDGNLRTNTEVGWVEQLAPFAYQLSPNGDTIHVACQFLLRKNTVTYDFPEGYDTSKPLIIDPVIAFSTYIGSEDSSFGFTASYDSEGHAYAGGVVFGFNYPTVPGSYQVDFGGGDVDCAITKFSSDGSNLIYSTFLGGNSGESPHSLVVDGNDELYILGSTGSDDFPVTSNAYQTIHSGGPVIAGAGYTYANGSDIFVAKLSSDGSSLLASTFIGGSGTDGVGHATILDYNYGDKFRGEIVLDAAGNAYVASVTESDNFPVVNGYSSSFGGTLAGVVFKLSANLSNLIWSTYSGGTGIESAYSLQLASDNSVYFVGSTTSEDLPTSPNGYQPVKDVYVDGYVGHISADGSQLLNCTYNGTLGYDQNYFVQLDTEGNVYIVGQSVGDYPISPNVYSNPNSKQFIQKFNPTLTTSIWSTQVGSGSGTINFSPSAFLVSNCGQIYLSGWGGTLSSPTGSTNNLPTSPDAFQTTTDGNDFYLMVLAPDAESLIYGTFLGGPDSPEHVDGGTSRFDKNGTVYQAVCAGCFGNSDFPTTPGVWSQTNGSALCNLAVIKFKLSAVNAVAEIDGPDIVCPGSIFNLNNLSVDADSYLWTFSDGNTSTEESLTYSFADPGTYNIKLLASNQSGCIFPDSTMITVEVIAPPNVQITDPAPVCPGQTVQLEASGADTWQWIPVTGLSSATVANPIFSGSQSTNYTLIGNGDCGSDTALVNVTVGNLNTGVNDDKVICPGESVQLEATGGTDYSWTPATGLSDPNIANPEATPETTTDYTVSIVTDDGCDATETVTVQVLPPAPTLSGNNRYVSCSGTPVSLLMHGADEYSWSPAVGLSSDTIPNPLANPANNTTYTVTGTNICGSDQLIVNVYVGDVHVSILTDSVVCYQSPFYLEGFGADSYIWQPANVVLNSHQKVTQAIIEGSTMIKVTGFDTLGCYDVESVLIQIYPRTIVRAGNDFVINHGDEVQLESSSIYPIQWEYSPYLSCLNCNFPIANPPENTTFYASIVSPDGCSETDSVRVSVRGLIYVPNAFSPDDDGLNDIFKAEGVDISEFHMEIFDRWGKLVFTSEDISHGWNGSFRSNGYFCSPDVYQYKIVATENQGNLFELKGHVTLLR